MTALDEEIERIASRIRARIAEEPAACGDCLALSPVGREAVRRILDTWGRP